MKIRIVSLALALVCSLALHTAHAQTTQQADYIVAIVNEQPITNNELRAAIAQAKRQLTQNERPIPPEQNLRSEVLERLINERAQVQQAKAMGIRIDQLSVDQAEENAARQNQVSVADLRKRLAKDGVDKEAFHAQLRDQLLLAKLHEREVDSRVRITEPELDRYIEEQQNANTDPFMQEINLAQILIAIPEKATLKQIPVLQAQAQSVLERIRKGESFEALVQELSAAQRDKGGQLGLRRGDRYPRAFVLATQSLEVGGVSEIVRSAAGFHILKVIEKRQPQQIVKTVLQTRARHILLRTSAQLTTEAAVARLSEFKRRIKNNSATFQSLAREFSQDSSAQDGGDLGWAVPGMFVPEFEDTMNRLVDSDVSEPLVSRFGVHLIQVIERRRVDLAPPQVREFMRNELREVRYEEAFIIWAQELRARAFVQYREPPQ